MRSLLLLTLLACGQSAVVSQSANLTRSDTLSLLTYNVAGLPSTFSQSKPQHYTVQISPLLNAYDVVLVQEDFWYHQDLVGADTHAYRSFPYRDPPRLTDIGDGLNLFSRFPFGGYTRTAWSQCNGVVSCDEDCLASKGFSFAVLTPADGVRIHLYDVHFDAGGCDGDQSVRSAQATQLASAVATSSVGAAVIIAGDTNMYTGFATDMASLDRLITGNGMRDVCRELQCGAEIIDRILVRNGDGLVLTPLQYRKPPEFITAGGTPLSDHVPVEAIIQWERTN